MSAEESDFAPIILKKINAVKGERAVINISGFGFYELFINGERVGEDFYKPAVSDYAPRDFSHTYPLSDKTSHRVYYNSYDITKYLKSGENTLAVMLGKGYYCQKKRVAEGDTSFGAEALSGFHSLNAEAFSEEYQKAVIEKTCEVIDEIPYVIGEHVWNFADFKTREGVLRPGGNRKGVFTKERQPKLSAYYLRERLENKKGK